MSRFSTPSKIQNIVYDMRNSDTPRSTNRARIDSLFNGNPPYTDAEVNKNLASLYAGLPQPVLRRFGETTDREEELL